MGGRSVESRRWDRGGQSLQSRSPESRSLQGRGLGRRRRQVFWRRLPRLGNLGFLRPCDGRWLGRSALGRRHRDLCSGYYGIQRRQLKNMVAGLRLHLAIGFAHEETGLRAPTSCRTDYQSRLPRLRKEAVVDFQIRIRQRNAPARMRDEPADRTEIFQIRILLIRPTRSGNNGDQTRKHRGALDVS